MNSLHLGHVTFVRMFDVSCCRRPTPSISLQLKLRQLEVKEQPTGSLQLQVSLHQSALEAGLHPLQPQSRSWTRRQISAVNSEHLEFPPRSFVSTCNTTTTVSMVTYHGWLQIEDVYAYIRERESCDDWLREEVPQYSGSR